MNSKKCKKLRKFVKYLPMAEIQKPLKNAVLKTPTGESLPYVKPLPWTYPKDSYQRVYHDMKRAITCDDRR